MTVLRIRYKKVKTHPVLIDALEMATMLMKAQQIETVLETISLKIVNLSPDND
jgi:hypothetical protein